MASIVHATIGGTTYCHRSESYYDKGKKQSRAKRNMIGKIDPVTGEMVPTGPRGRKPKQQADIPADPA